MKSNSAHNLGSNCCVNQQTVFLIGSFLEAVIWRQVIGRRRSSCVPERSQWDCFWRGAAALTSLTAGIRDPSHGESLREKPDCGVKNSTFTRRRKNDIFWIYSLFLALTELVRLSNVFTVGNGSHMGCLSLVWNGNLLNLHFPRTRPY